MTINDEILLAKVSMKDFFEYLKLKKCKEIGIDVNNKEQALFELETFGNDKGW